MWRDFMVIAAGASVMISGCLAGAPSESRDAEEHATLALPPPATDGDRSLEEVLAARRSVRQFADQVLDEGLVAQLLWSAQGVTSDDGQRTAPSAGGLYPLELYLVDETGAYRYLADEHALLQVDEADLRRDLGEAAGQDAVRAAAVVFVVTGVSSRTAERYGDRAQRYVQLEAGHAAQNLLLQATALGLASVPIGAFDDDAVAAALALPGGEDPLYLLPVGFPDGP